MDLPRISRIGLLFLFLGALLFAGWVLWVKTRITRPVDMPVSMSPGHFRSREFNINLEAVYLIEIAADKNKIPADTLRCLLGYKILDSDCAETPSVVKASWVLSSGGHVMAHGTTDDPGGGAVTNNEIARAIGAFDGEEGCRYVLDVDILGDGSKLAPGNPRLRVELFPYPAGKMAWGPAILLVTVIMELIGIVLLIISGTKRWRLRRTTLFQGDGQRRSGNYVRNELTGTAGSDLLDGF